MNLFMESEMNELEQYVEFLETGVINTEGEIEMKPESKEDKLSKVHALQIEIQELLGRVYGNQKNIIKLLEEVKKPQPVIKERKREI